MGAFEVTLLEMTRAYGVLAAEGIRAPLRCVLAVRTPEDQELAEHRPQIRAVDVYKTG